MPFLKLATTVSALIAFTAFVWASESDELKERAEAMRREAAELAEQGHKKEAANLERKAMAMLEEAERLERNRPDQNKHEVLELKQLLEKLHHEKKELEDTAGGGERLADVRREVERVEMELRHLTLRPHRMHAGPHDEIARRLEHMRIAVDHLSQAGLHEIAERVAERAEAAERELHQHRKQRGDDAMHEIIKQLDELRHEVERLRHDVSKLSKRR